MKMHPKITLEQWRALVAVVDAGGYARAAQQLHKSQSAVSYAVQKLETLLGIKVFEVEGRKAVLTTAGQQLYQQARTLLEEAVGVEQVAQALAQGWEAQIRIAAEVIFPTWLLLSVMDRFAQDSPNTRIELTESVMGGTSEALITGQVDLAIAPVVPPGFHGEELMQMRVMPVAHPDHPLHHMSRPLRMSDLRQHRHIVVRDTGSTRDSSALTIEAKQRWTVSNMATSIHALCQGYGFAWMVEHKIQQELLAGQLKRLPLEGQERVVTMYLIVAHPERSGRGVKRFAELLRAHTGSACAAVTN